MIFRPYKKIKELKRKYAGIKSAVRLARLNDDLRYLRGY